MPTPTQVRLLIRLSLSLLLFVFGTVFSACQKEHKKEPSTGKEIPLESLIPQTSQSEPLNEVYAKLQPLLQETHPRMENTIEITRLWAEKHLKNFAGGSCANFQVVDDSEFASAFGNSTLAVTFPWMQIFFRNGQRSGGPYLWRSLSLFVSTVLHEYVHASQRANQSRLFLREGENCLQAQNALIERRAKWSLGFEILSVSPFLNSEFSDLERTLIYQWMSPIERARDEVDASLVTLNWMQQNSASSTPDTDVTLGAVDNWVYALQYLQQLRALSSTDCFSPDPAAFEHENQIYSVEIPKFIEILQAYQPSIQTFFKKHHLQFHPIALQEFWVTANPLGRIGNHCGLGARIKIPPLPMQVKPIPIDEPVFGHD